MSSPATPSIHRGEIYWLDFSPATGSEMSAVHPCLIVQNDIGNQHSALTIVAAVTSNLRVAALPVGVLVKAPEGGLAHDSVIHCGHIYTVDKKRLGKRLGQLASARMLEVDRALICSIGL